MSKVSGRIIWGHPTPPHHTTPHHHFPSSSFWTPLERIIIYIYFRLEKEKKNSKISPFFLGCKNHPIFLFFLNFKIFHSKDKKRKWKTLLHILLLEVKPNPIKMSYILSPQTVVATQWQVKDNYDLVVKVVKKNII